MGVRSRPPSLSPYWLSTRDNYFSSPSGRRQLLGKHFIENNGHLLVFGLSLLFTIRKRFSRVSFSAVSLRRKYLVHTRV